MFPPLSTFSSAPASRWRRIEIAIKRTRSPWRRRWAAASDSPACIGAERGLVLVPSRRDQPLVERACAAESEAAKRVAIRR